MCLVSSISPHPIFVSTGILWIGLKLFLMYYTSTDKGMDDGTTMDFSNALSMYKPAGSLLLKLLSPTVISFSLSIFSRRRVLYENLGAILAGSIVSGLGTLYGTAAFVRLISLGGPIDVSDDMALATPAAILRLSTLDRNVVAPLAVNITQTLGGNTSIQLGSVVVTGVLCVSYTRPLLLDGFYKKLYPPVQDPVA